MAKFDEAALRLVPAEPRAWPPRTTRAAEDWRKALEHERNLGLHWHDRLNIQNPQVSDPGAPVDPD